MKQDARTFKAVDARGDAYMIVVKPEAAESVALETSTGRKVRRLAKGRYLVTRREGEWNDVEVTCADAAAP